MDKVGWFERSENQLGDINFIFVAQSEDELLHFIASDTPSVELVQLDSEFGKKVCDEFTSQFMTNNLELFLAKERAGKKRLLMTTGISLVGIGLLLFGLGIYFRWTYSPNNFKDGEYKFLFQQVYWAGLSGILVGSIMDFLGVILVVLALLRLLEHQGAVIVCNNYRHQLLANGYIY